MFLIAVLFVNEKFIFSLKKKQKNQRSFFEGFQDSEFVACNFIGLVKKRVAERFSKFSLTHLVKHSMVPTNFLRRAWKAVVRIEKTISLLANKWRNSERVAKRWLYTNESQTSSVFLRVYAALFQHVNIDQVYRISDVAVWNIVIVNIDCKTWNMIERFFYKISGNEIADVASSEADFTSSSE